MRGCTIGKLALVSVVGLLILVMVFGCAAPAPAPVPAPAKSSPVSSPTPAKTEIPPPAGVTKMDLEILGAGQGGTGWAMAHAYAAIINKYGPTWLRAAGVATRGTTDNLITVYKNPKARPFTIMYLSEPMIDAAMLGLKDWGFTEKVTVRPLILNHCSTTINPVAVLGTKIKTWADLAGKKIVTDKPGSAKRAIFMDMVAADNLKIEAVNVTLDEGTDLLISGQADGVVGPLQFAGPNKGMPTAGMINLLAQKSGQVNMISIPKEVVEKAAKATSINYKYAETPAKYADPSIDYPLGSVSDNLVWGTFPEFPEDIAYLVTKLAYEHAEEFASYHAVGEGASRVAMPWIGTPENTHKGAMKFYQEKGLKVELPAQPIQALRAAK